LLHEQARDANDRGFLGRVRSRGVYTRVLHCKSYNPLSVRLLDALILPDEPHGRARFQDYEELADRNVIVVQTKARRMGMYLMGQALFSARLVMAQGAKSVRSILLCTGSDSALLPLLKPFPEVEVWVYDKNNPGICSRAGDPLILERDVMSRGRAGLCLRRRGE